MWEALLAPSVRAASPAPSCGEASRCSVSSCRGWAGTGGFPRLGSGRGGCQLREAELWRLRYASALHVLSDKRFSSQRAPWARPTPSSGSCHGAEPPLLLSAGFHQENTCSGSSPQGRSPPALLPPHQLGALGAPSRCWPTLCLSPGPPPASESPGLAGNAPWLVGSGRNVQHEGLSRVGFSFPGNKNFQGSF